MSDPHAVRYQRLAPLDRRAVERNNLRLALATFAFHLDAFEARLRGVAAKTSAQPSS
jgi:hypothetical protein